MPSVSELARAEAEAAETPEAITLLPNVDTGGFSAFRGLGGLGYTGATEAEALAALLEAEKPRCVVELGDGKYKSPRLTYTDKDGDRLTVAAYKGHTIFTVSNPDGPTLSVGMADSEARQELKAFLNNYA